MGLRLTLAQIKAKIRQKFDLPETVPGNPWPTDAALLGMINDALDDVMGTLTKTPGSYWYETTVVSVLTPPTDSITMPNDFVRLSEGPYLSTDAGVTYVPLRQAARGIEALRAGPQNTPYEYDLIDGKLLFGPRPVAAVSIMYRYRRHTGGLAIDADIFDGPHGWASYVGACVGHDLALKSSQNTIPWVTAKSQAFALFSRQANVIDENVIEQVADVRYQGGMPIGDQELYSWLRSGPAARRF